MNLKTNEDGTPIVQDGKPVYLDAEGNDFVFDAAEAMSKIKALNNEAKNHRLNAEQLKADLAKLKTQTDTLSEQAQAFEGIDARKAKRALEKIAKIDAGDLLEMDKVELIKQQLKDEFDDTQQQLTTNFNQREKEYQKQIETVSAEAKAKDDKIYDLMVNNGFAGSTFINEQTTMTWDVAMARFGKHFTIEPVDGDLKMVAYLNGEKILSRKTPGELAGFDEAFQIIWNAYPNKDSYTRASAGGSASGGGKQPNDAGEPSNGLADLYTTMS